MNTLEEIGNGIKSVLGWFGQVIVAATDWGWIGISEWTVILLILGFLTWLGITILKK